MHFRCNLKCEHCMIEGTMDRLDPLPDEEFERVVELNARERRWKGLVFTGSEITLRSDLPALARRARAAGFERIRIQTHGMRLSRSDYCAELVDAGVNEYFVSLTAADAATHDRITGIPGSFDKTMAGLQNLERFSDVAVFTNTVITQRSYQQLEAVVRRVASLHNLVQMEFWNYLPMSEIDERDLIVANVQILPHLRAAVASARSSGRKVVIKNYPECLLADEGDAVETHHPDTLIDPRYWDEYNRNELGHCAHWDACTATNCFGLTSAYIDKFGWDADLLKPFGTTSPPQTTVTVRRVPGEVPVPIRTR